jgi:hypothetical protein
LFLKIKTFKKGTFIFDLLDGDLAFFPFLFSIGFVGIEEKLLNLKPLFLDVASGGIWGVGLMKSGFWNLGFLKRKGEDGFRQ